MKKLLLFLLLIPALVFATDNFNILDSTSSTISGGTINNTPIGGTTPAAGAFTTLSASGHTTFEGVVSTGATGTGNIVYSTSPTLVTPILGTPTSGVATNLTGTASGLTAGNVTTNANLTGAVTSVGNATSLGSFTSSSLMGAISDETGTGAAVFANTPTLVTPVIGAATGTSLSVSGSLTSTVVTGTAPLVVSSTTNVANLNASSLGGATFAAPGAIGGGTAAAGSFTSLGATGTSTLALTNISNLLTVAKSANTTQILLALRNSDGTASGAGQTRMDFGNDLGTNKATIALSSSTNASTPGWLEIVNQANNPVLLGANGSDIIGVSGVGVINGVNSNRLLFGTAAPTISSGFGTSPSILTSNGATTFRINVGTGGTATGGVLGMPTATTGWNCTFSVLNPTATNVLSQNTQTSSTTTTVTIQNDLSATGAATAWPASTTLIAFCAAY